MNINSAKEYIKNSIRVYLKKDEYGDYRIPVVRQRPIFLLGAPGIGKTAIMEQIAEELGIALVSYSMTHHTRQSALGLPFIKQKVYGGVTYDVSEYTMSEIIASVYETMENSGIKEGILFLDEINCVSETLAPSMLQFLQYKVFGRNRVPDGWVIVTAGNPPEYNKSVREFDVVTMDRLKVLNVEADYKTWKEYAAERGVHTSILSFLEIHKDYFYHMETTVKGRSYVTARGWEDLSEVIGMYEEEKLKVDENLISQYIQNENIVKEYAAYYDLYNKYKADYRINELLSGNISDASVAKAAAAPFDERLSLVGMLLDSVKEDMKELVTTSDYLQTLLPILRELKTSHSIQNKLEEKITEYKSLIESLTKANTLSAEKKGSIRRVIGFLSDAKKELMLSEYSRDEEYFELIKYNYDSILAQMKDGVAQTNDRLHNLFEFASRAFEGGNEMLIVVTDMTVGKYSSRYISMFGCEDYYKYNRLLMVTERQNDMKNAVAGLKL